MTLPLSPPTPTTTTAVDDRITTDQDTPVTINVLANDNGSNGAPINGPSIVGGPANGAVTVNSDGTNTYTPSSGFIGTDSFVYGIESGGDSDDATVTVVVGLVQGPIAIDDEISTPSGVPVTIDVLANDIGRGGSPVSLVGITSAPIAGVANENPDGTITYTPTTGFTGTDTFAYTITDDGVAQDTATVTVSVIALFNE